MGSQESSSTKTWGMKAPSTNEPIPELVVISDCGQDLDDEMSFIMMRNLVEQRHARVLGRPFVSSSAATSLEVIGPAASIGIVTTLAPSFDRARLARGTLDLLGMNTVPVAFGSDGGDIKGNHTSKPFADATYLPSAHSEAATSLEPARALMYRLWREAKVRSLTLLVNASLKDAALFVRDNESLFVAKTKEVVIMGGVKVTEDGAVILPDDAHNNMFDKTASLFFYRKCRSLGVHLVVLSRWAAYACKVPRSIYDELALSGSSIGWRLRDSQRSSIEGLWARAAAAEGPARKGLPPRCDRDWFATTFCAGADVSSRGSADPIWDLVDGFMQYDTLSSIAAVPTLRKRFFEPRIYDEGRTEVIGLTAEVDGVRKDRRAELGEVMQTGFATGISLHHHYKTFVVIVYHERSVQTCLERAAAEASSFASTTDGAFFGAMLRTLYELDVVCVCGIVLLHETTAAAGVGDGDGANDLRAVLRRLGLAHIPLLLGDPSSVERSTEHIRELYDLAPPVGVELVNIAPATHVAAFAEAHSTLFRARTSRLVLMCGALLKGGTLVPDPESPMTREDAAAAASLLGTAQHLSIPIVVLSRRILEACRVPRAFYDALAQGGTLGAELARTHRTSILELWQRCVATATNRRRGLLAKYDRAWFLEAYCVEGATVAADAPLDDVWKACGAFDVSAALTLLAALPSALIEAYLPSTLHKVRSATHTLFGDAYDPSTILKVRALIFQSLYKGVMINLSQYDLETPPPVPLSDDDDTMTGPTWQYDPHDAALQWVKAAIFRQKSPRRSVDNYTLDQPPHTHLVASSLRPHHNKKKKKSTAPLTPPPPPSSSSATPR